MGVREPRLHPRGLGLIKTQRHATTTTLLVVVVAVAAAFGSAFPGYGSTSEFHAGIEIVGALLGFTAAYALLARFLANGNRIDLFVGLAFAINAAEDVAHGWLPLAVARGWIQILAVDLERFIPATYATGRLLMALTLLAGVVWADRLGTTTTPASEARKAVAIGSVIAIAATVTAFFWEAPRAVLENSFISRPADLVSAAAFAAAGWLLLARPRGIGGERWLAMSAFLGAAGQVVIALSGSLFDARFDLGHAAKILSYALPILGFVSGQIQVIARERLTVEELREADAAKTAFLGSVTHELRTPLAAIQGFTAILEKDPEPEPALRRNIVARIRRNALALNTLVEDILLFSRLEADRLALTPTEVELGTVAREVVARLGPLLGDRAVEVPQDDLVVLGDRPAIAQVVTNLVTNAAYYTPPDATVRLGVLLRDGHGWLVCEDSGPGVPVEERDAIFERFHRGRGAVASKRPGTGIGLNVVQKLVAGMGGSITVDTSPDLGGARFLVGLPLPSPRATLET